MTDITLTPEQFEAALQYTMSVGAYQNTSGSGMTALRTGRQAWEKMKHLGTPMLALDMLETQVGKLP